MKMVPNEFKRGPGGPAEVVITGKKVRIEFIKGYAQKPNPFAGQVFLFTVDALPLKSLPSGEYNVLLNTDGDSIFGICPLNQTVQVKFTHFSSPTDQNGNRMPPTPKRDAGTRQGKNGPYQYDEMKFTAIGEITSPRDFRGLEVAMPFLYNFRDDGEGGLAISGTGARSQMLNDFLRVAYGGDFQMPFSDNILPKLELLLQSAEREFMVVIKNGWPSSYADAMNGVSRKPAKKPAKLVTKKRK